MVEQLTSLTQLVGKQYSSGDITLEAPNGDELAFRVKFITEGEVRKLRREMAWPEAPTTFDKDRKGKVIRITNENDAGFKEALEDANRVFSMRLLLMSLIDVETPGETPEEQAAYLSDTVPAWAVVQLSDKIMAVSGIQKAALDAEVEELQGNR